MQSMSYVISSGAGRSLKIREQSPVAMRVLEAALVAGRPLPSLLGPFYVDGVLGSLESYHRRLHLST
jgi:hypothetical protein